ncbi:MAG: GreA/GreB family elongation factor [Actinomycetota bacterium]
MGNEPVVTTEGMRALEEKLQYLETTRRREVSEQMKTAVDHGDVSDSAEYDEARKAFLKLNREIEETASLIARARVVRDRDISTDCVGVGSLVSIEEADGGATQELRLVGPTETDPDSGKISHLCPLGMSLMDSKLGDVVEVKTPAGTRTYRVVGISK